MSRLTRDFDYNRDDHHDALYQAFIELMGDDVSTLIRALRDPREAMTRDRPAETPSCPDALYLFERLARILDAELERADALEAGRAYLMADARMELAADERLDELNRSREP